MQTVFFRENLSLATRTDSRFYTKRETYQQSLSLPGVSFALAEDAAFQLVICNGLLSHFEPEQEKYT